MATCDKCHETFHDTVKFCPRDGTALGATAAAMNRTTMQCPRCGAKYRGQKFCARDGSVLEAAS